MAIAFVQSKSVQYTLSGSARTLAFTSNVTAGSLLVVAVSTFTAGITVTVSDNVNGSHAQAGGYAGGGTTRVSLWYIANAGAGATTVTVMPSGSAYVTIAIHEYSGAATSSVLDSTSTNTGTSTSMSSGTVAVNQSGSLVVGAFTSPSTFSSPAAGASYTFREQLPSAAINQPIMTEDHIGVSSGEAATMSTSGSIGWQAIGASFKPPAALDPWLPSFGPSITKRDLLAPPDTGGLLSGGEGGGSAPERRLALPPWLAASSGGVAPGDWHPSQRPKSESLFVPTTPALPERRHYPLSLFSGTPSPPNPQLRGKAKPYVERDPRNDRRRRARIADKMSEIINALVRSGQLARLNLGKWEVRPKAVQVARAPTSADDITTGVVPGMTWINTVTTTAYICVDNSAGAASWKAITS